MSKIDIGIYALTGLCIIGIVVLSVLNKSFDVLVPILTALIGVVAGKQGGLVYRKVAGAFKKNK